MEQWALQHQFLLSILFLKNNESIAVTLRLFRNNFHVPGHGAVPCWNTNGGWTISKIIHLH